MAIDYKNSIKLECVDCGNTTDFVMIERTKFNAETGKWDKRTKSAYMFCKKCQSNRITIYAFPEVNPLKV